LHAATILRAMEKQAGVAQSQPRKRRCFQADRPTILNSKTYDRADDLNYIFYPLPLSFHWRVTGPELVPLWSASSPYWSTTASTRTQSLLTHQTDSRLLGYYQPTLQSRGQDLFLRNPPSPDLTQHPISRILTNRSHGSNRNLNQHPATPRRSASRLLRHPMVPQQTSALLDRRQRQQRLLLTQPRRRPRPDHASQSESSADGV
jgi:hypothetical protein